MNPAEVTSFIQTWILKQQNVNLSLIRRLIFSVMSIRYAIDPVKNIVYDEGTETPTGTPKEGFQVRVIKNSILEWKVQYAECILKVPKAKVTRSLAGSTLDDAEEFSTIQLFLDAYE